MRSTGLIRVARLGAASATFLLVAAQLPQRWFAREAPAWQRGDPALRGRLAAGLAPWIARDLGAGAYGTGSVRFDGEWLFGTYMMAGMGFGQMALDDPTCRPAMVPLLETCAARLLSAPAQAFDRDAWGEGAIESLDGPSGHAAYLGYGGMVLGMVRRHGGAPALAETHDRIAATLARRLEHAPLGLLETYPGEVYPVDNAAVAAALALHADATGRPRPAALDRWVRQLPERWLDPATGLLHQAVDPATGKPVDHPRGSGTALAAYFISFVDPPLARRLYDAARHQLYGTVLGFGAVREYPRGVFGLGDIDSGPVIFGHGVSATGFLIGPARQHRDGEAFRRLYATAHLMGAPRDEGGARQYVTGGPLGNAIMLAMLTAPEVEP